MSLNRVAVFPASGGIGGSTVKHLLPRLPSKDLTFITRRPEKLTDASSSGATVRWADYDDDNSLLKAFENVDTLFLISYASVEHEHRSEVKSRSNPMLDVIKTVLTFDVCSVIDLPLMRQFVAE
jgi:uncharacterized protein YbjT (DUF2867 family)